MRSKYLQLRPFVKLCRQMLHWLSFAPPVHLKLTPRRRPWPVSSIVYWEYVAHIRGRFHFVTEPRSRPSAMNTRLRLLDRAITSLRVRSIVSVSQTEGDCPLQRIRASVPNAPAQPALAGSASSRGCLSNETMTSGVETGRGKCIPAEVSSVPFGNAGDQTGGQRAISGIPCHPRAN